MKRNIVITIARQYGSGGRTVGEMLANDLGIHYYDHELIHLASEESGISLGLFLDADERVRNTGFFKTPVNVYKGELIGPDSKEFTSEANLFNYQAKVIKRLAETTSCVIVGRCADYVLRDMDALFSVFLTSPAEIRAERVAMRAGISIEEAAELIEKKDKARSEYYNYYTFGDWGFAASYDLCIDSSILGIEGTTDFIIDFAKKAGII